jgi:HK97 family phage prohead protease
MNMHQVKSRKLDHFFTTLDEIKFASAESGHFEGYASVFNVVDQGGDLITKGAFRDTLKEWKKLKRLPKLLAQHGFGETSLPVGKWLSMEEDERGLKVTGQLFAPETDTLRLIHQGMKAGELDGLSIGYRVKTFDYGTKPGEPRRTLKAVELFEVSVVTFPMNTSATVSAVKGVPQTIREFEAFLRDAGGFSHAAAKKIAAGGFKDAPQPRDEGEQPSAGDLLAAAIATIRKVQAK